MCYWTSLDNPAIIGRFINLSYKPTWKSCSEDAHIIKQKKDLGLDGEIRYCLRCAVLDGWIHYQVFNSCTVCSIYDSCDLKGFLSVYLTTVVSSQERDLLEWKNMADIFDHRSLICWRKAWLQLLNEKEELINRIYTLIISHDIFGHSNCYWDKIVKG